MLVNKASDLEPMIPEKYLVFTIMQHFRENIRLSSMGKPTETIQEALTFLTSVDTMEESRRGNWTTNQARDGRETQTFPNQPNPRSYSDTQNRLRPQILNKPGPSKTQPNPPRNLNG